MDTVKLNAWLQGELSYEDEFFNSVYPLLKSLVRSQLKTNKSLELKTTQLANDAFIRLSQISDVTINNKQHFKMLFAKMVRRMIVDVARQRNSEKYGGQFDFVSLEEVDRGLESNLTKTDYLSIHRSIEELEKLDPQSAQIIELRFFGGCTLEEIAEILSTSISSVSRQWAFAKSWLKNHLDE